jgi:hypothetical protein
MPTNIYRFGESEPLRGRLECECYLCGRRFFAWRSRYLRTGARWCSAQCYRDTVRTFWQELRRENVRVLESGGNDFNR